MCHDIILFFFFVGGSLAKFLCNGLPELKTDWSKWRIFFCDERHVPYNDPECTYSIYRDKLVNKVAMPTENIFPIQPEMSGKISLGVYKYLLNVFTKGEDWNPIN